MKRSDDIPISSRVALEDTVVTSKDALWADLQGEAVVLHMSSGVYFGLEGAGLDVWKFIQAPRTLSQILDHLTSLFEVPPRICQDSTLAFLAKLAEHDLVLIDKHAVSP
jgi:hypothetical protein